MSNDIEKTRLPDKYFDQFLKSNDSKIHKQAIGIILKHADEKKSYSQLLKNDEANISHMLSIFKDITQDKCQSKSEFEFLRKIGTKTVKYTKEKQYQKIVDLGYNLVVDNLLVSLGLVGEEYKKMKLEDFYSKHLPDDIYAQYVLLEIMAINPDYNWKRDDKIIHQSLVLAGMCFMDIYEYIHDMNESEEDDDLEDETEDEFKLPEKNELYYEAMDMANAGEYKTAIKLLQVAIKIDPEFVDAYVGLTAVYRDMGNLKKEKECADIGFELTKKQFPKWPSEMPWGMIENRAFMRSICDKAMTAQISGDQKTAEELYRLLLKMNPGDNQGIRYLIAGMLEGISPDDVDKMTDEGNEKQDWSAQEKMVARQNKIHKFWKEPKYD